MIKRKMIVLTVIPCLIMCIGSLVRAEIPARETLSVLSYNIHMWESSVETLTEVIKAANPDIVGLNEAWNEKKNGEIAKTLGYNIICGGQGDPGGGTKRSHCVNDYYMPQVLLTRHKIVHSKVFNAMATEKWESKPDFDPNMPIYRGGTLAVLETAKGNRVAVFVLHLHPWGGDDEKMTEMRLNEIKGIVGKVKPYADLPVLLIGDFNTRSHLDGIKGWKVTSYLDKQGYKDLYRTVHPNPEAFPGKTAPEGRIDYIFCNQHVTPTSAKVLSDGVFGSGGFDDSDHLAVYGEFEIRAQKKLDNTFYCQNTLWGFENKPKTALEKAVLMKTIGFDGLEGFGYKDFFQLKDALDRQGLEMPVNYVTIEFKEDEKLDDTSVNEIKAMIESTGQGRIIYFSIINKSQDYMTDAGDKIVASAFRELADFASVFGVKLCSYPHVNMYCETLAHSVKLAKLVKRKNFGASLNLCHLLKVEGTEGLDSKIEEFTPFLFAVNICGADDGDTKQFGWNRLIQPLGKGSFDTYRFVKSLRDNGYMGPIGLQCYNLKGDVLETLTQSMKTWKDYKKRYAEEK